MTCVKEAPHLGEVCGTLPRRRTANDRPSLPFPGARRLKAELRTPCVPSSRKPSRKCPFSEWNRPPPSALLGGGFESPHGGTFGEVCGSLSRRRTGRAGHPYLCCGSLPARCGRWADDAAPTVLGNLLVWVFLQRCRASGAWAIRPKTESKMPIFRVEPTATEWEIYLRP
jgi:hypothetical protein